jgi:hypothetical protein
MNMSRMKLPPLILRACPPGWAVPAQPERALVRGSRARAIIRAKRALRNGTPATNALANAVAFTLHE